MGLLAEKMKFQYTHKLFHFLFSWTCSAI